MKYALKIVVVILLCIGLFSTVYVFTGALKPSDLAKVNNVIVIDVSEIKPDKAIKVNGFFYVVRLDDQEIRVYEGWAPYRKCKIEYVERGDAVKSKYFWGAYEKAKSITHFRDVCDGAIWMLDGKRVEGTGDPRETDLNQRNYRKISDQKIEFSLQENV